MATFTKINSFVEAICEKVHNLGSDQLKIALTNTAHNSSWTQLSDLTQVSYTNLSGATPLNVSRTSSSQAAGTYTLVLQDLTLTATGVVGPFQYVYLYNDSATNKELIALWDRGSAVTLASGDTFLIDFASTTISIT